MSNKPRFPGPGFSGSKRDEDDDDDDKGRPTGSSPFNRGGDKPGAAKPPSSPFGSRSPFGAKANDLDDEDEDDDDDNKDSKPGSFGGNKLGGPARPAGTFGGGKPADSPKPGSPFGGKPADSSKPGGQFGGGRPADSPKSGSPFGGNKPAEPPKPGGQFGGGRPADSPKSSSPFGGNKPAEPPKPGGMFGGKPAEKKDDSDKKDNKPGGGPFGGRLPFGGGNKPADKPAGDKKDDKPGGPLGGIRSPFGGGNKPADKPAGDKKDDKSGGGPLGGVRLPFGKKPDDKPAAAAPRLPVAGGKPTDKKDDKSGGGLFGGRMPFGKKPEGAAAAKPDDKKATSAFPAAQPRPGDPRRTTGSAPSAAAPVAPPKPATAAPDLKKAGGKVPPARGDKVAKPLDKAPRQVTVQRGLSLDQKLDLVGYGLIILGVLIFFGIVQPSEGSVTKGLADLLGQLFGTGRIVLPIPCLAIGLWLFVRHFNENPLVIKAHRATGWILMYLTFVTTLHFIELLQRPVPNMSALVKMSDAVAKANLGGGWVGGELYKLLMQVGGDYGTPVLLVGFWMIAAMLAFSITLAEIAIYVKSVFRWFGRARGSYAERRRVAGEARAAALAAKAAANPPLTIEKPAPAGAIEAGAAPAAAALASPARKPGIPERTGVPEKATAGESPALMPATPPPLGSKSADAAPDGGRKPMSTPARPFGKAPARLINDQEPEDEEDIDNEPAAPLTRPAPVPLGARTSTTAAVKPTEAKPEAKAEVKSDAAPAKPGLFGQRPDAPQDKPKPGPFGALPGKPADDDDKKADSQPAAPVVKPEPLARTTAGTDAPGGKPNSPFGPKPIDAKAEDVKPTASGNAPAPTAEVKTVDRPADKPADKEAASGKPDNEKPVEPAPKPATPIGSRSPFGSGKPASSPIARPGDADSDDTDDDAAKTDKLAPTQARPAAPGNKPSPFGGGKPASNLFAKPGDDDEDEDEKPAAARVNPATPIGSRSPFGAGKPASNPIGKPGDDIDDDEATDDKPAAFKPATPIGGNRPNPFGSGKPGSSPVAKPADNKADNRDEGKDDKPAFKPATPIGNRPSPFGAPSNPMTKPVPKSGLATPPPLDDEDEEPDEEPKYVNVDDVDDLDDVPRSDGPRPTLTGRPGVPPPPMPRPANPVTARPRPGGNPGTASAVKPNEPAAQPVKAENKPTPDQTPVKPGGASLPAAKSDAPETTTSPAPTPKETDVKVPSAQSKSAEPAVVKPDMVPKPAPAESPKSAAQPNQPSEGVIVRSKTVNGWETPDFRELLEPGSQQKITDEVLQQRAQTIEETLSSFGAPGKVIEINTGPVITQFGVEPDYLVSRQGKKTRVKVSAIARLDADLALSLAARSIRIEAPVPGKGYVGIEVPNAETALVSLRDIMDSPEFQKVDSKLRIALGKSVDGAPIAADLTKMPHLLIAGTTGSGKSVCVNAIIACLLLENTPDDMKFIMVDPKRVELTGYNGIPHLVSPVVVDLERIVGVLKWVTREMEERYKKFSQAGARNITDFNSRVGPTDPKLPYLVVIIDELADLMMLAPEETEKVLTRLAQMARATGIHLIISTQRPSVDVVTGLIKANFPARISFAVASSVDSRVILDQPGAEKLLGRGDMLYQSPDASAPLRMQGVFLSDAEINRITRYWKGATNGQSETKLAPAPNFFDLGSKPEPVQSRGERFGQSNPGSKPASVAPNVQSSGTPSRVNSGSNGSPEEDELYEEAVKLVKQNKASVQLLQRRLRVNYARASRLIELMKQRGVIDGTISDS